MYFAVDFTLGTKLCIDRMQFISWFEPIVKFNVHNIKHNFVPTIANDMVMNINFHIVCKIGLYPKTTFLRVRLIVSLFNGMGDFIY